MKELTVRNLSQQQLRSKLARGEIIKICRGLHLWREPTPAELFAVLRKKNDGIALTGASAAQLWLGQKLTFPLLLAGTGKLPASEYYTFTRTQHRSITHRGFACHLPIIAAAALDSEEQALRLLEHVYASREGRALLEQHLSGIGRLPARARDLLRRAALFTDSEAEAKVIRRLKERGLAVECNVMIGPYRWDIVIPKLKVAVEIDGFMYHRRREDAIRDAWKSNDATLRGWITLRYTGSCVKHELDQIIAQIATAHQPDFSSIRHTGVRLWHLFFRRYLPGDMHQMY